MIYLSNLFRLNGGACQPLTQSYTDPDGNLKSTTNISVVSYNNNLILNTRLTDYLYIPYPTHDKLSRIHTQIDPNKSISCNTIGIFNSDYSVFHELVGYNNFLINNIHYQGLEDIRLVVWNNTLYGVGFRPDVLDSIIVQIIEYNDYLNINRSWFIKTNNHIEKNWQPITDRPFSFIYDPYTSAIVSLNIDELKEADDINNPSIINEIHVPEFSFKLSGSTQLIRLDKDHYISICHTSHPYIGADGYHRWVYNHYFIIYDNGLNKIWTSEPFRFIGNCMEFTCGMCIHNEELYISFSMYDGITHLLSISLDKFQDIISNMMTSSIPNPYDTPEVCTPNIDYMVDCWASGKITGIQSIIYMMFLETTKRLTNTSKLTERINQALQYIPYNEDREKLSMFFTIRKKITK